MKYMGSKNRIFKYKYLILLLCWTSYAHASCWNIQNEDRKNYCLAVTNTMSSYCWQINNEDYQKYCLSSVLGSKSYCWQINDNDLKNQCLALF